METEEWINQEKIEILRAKLTESASPRSTRHENV